jgi:hypothetical protein
MILVWIVSPLIVVVLLISQWRRLEHGFCVSALCLLQVLEEYFDAYGDKTVGRRPSAHVQRLCP